MASESPERRLLRTTRTVRTMAIDRTLQHIGFCETNEALSWLTWPCKGVTFACCLLGFQHRGKLSAEAQQSKSRLREALMSSTGDLELNFASDVPTSRRAKAPGRNKHSKTFKKQSQQKQVCIAAMSLKKRHLLRAAQRLTAAFGKAATSGRQGAEA